jgi:hypothetical protein
MLPVVETDAKDGRRLKRGKDLAGADDFIGYAVCSKEVALEAAGGAVWLKGCILDGAVVRLVSDEFH